MTLAGEKIKEKAFLRLIRRDEKEETLRRSA